MRVIACMLGGRAAETVILNAVMVGSSGHPGSDLGNATHLAIELETALGCLSDRPLIYRPPERTGDALLHHPPLADQVTVRLERAMEMATALLRAHRWALLSEARSLTDNLVLDDEQVRGLVAATRSGGEEPVSRAYLKDAPV